MIALREARIDQIDVEMGDLKVQLKTSLVLTPEDFDGRERLWMRREDLRHERAELSAAQTGWGMRLAERLFTRTGTPMVGSSMAIALFVLPT